MNATKRNPILQGGIAAAALLSIVPPIEAAPLDPLAFTSLGTPSFTTGTYQVDTSFSLSAPTLIGPGISLSGVFYDPTPGNAANLDEIAVFDFTSLTIGSGVVIQGLNNANSRPFALLSQGNFTLGGSILANGSDGGGGSDGPNVGGNAGPGGGGGGAGNGSSVGGLGLHAGGAGDGATGGNGGGPGGAGRAPGVSSANPNGSNGAGGGFGGQGGTDFRGNAPRGGTDGDLSLVRQGGSGGGGSGLRTFGPARGGGGGGGAVELGAVGVLTLTGLVSANGGGAGQGNPYGGNGSGGGILLHADSIVLNGSGTQLSANGGNLLGAGGGGGRIAFGTPTGSGPTGSNAPSGASVLGGDGADNGTITNFTVTPVPEPSTWIASALVVLGVVGRHVRERRRASKAT